MMFGGGAMGLGRVPRSNRQSQFDSQPAVIGQPTGSYESKTAGSRAAHVWVS
jgi:hypothetical protein